MKKDVMIVTGAGQISMAIARRAVSGLAKKSFLAIKAWRTARQSPRS